MGGSIWADVLSGGPDGPAWLLAHRPFIDPLDVHAYWFLLLIPMAVLISMTYKAVRLHSMDRYWREVGTMTAQVVLGLFALGMASFLLIELVVPVIVPMPS